MVTQKNEQIIVPSTKHRLHGLHEILRSPRNQFICAFHAYTTSTDETAIAVLNLFSNQYANAGTSIVWLLIYLESIYLYTLSTNPSGFLKIEGKISAINSIKSGLTHNDQVYYIVLLAVRLFFRDCCASFSPLQILKLALSRSREKQTFHCIMLIKYFNFNIIERYFNSGIVWTCGSSNIS